MHLLPQTTLGKITVALIVAMFVLFAIGMNASSFYEGVPAGDSILEELISRPIVSLSMLGGFICGTVSFFVGLVDVIRKKDFSILVFICLIIGLLLIYLLVGEVVSPH